MKIKHAIDSRKELFLPNSRVVLIKMDNDPFVHMEPGTLGTVRLVDDMGTVHVNWDNGLSLGAVLEDEIQLIAAERYGGCEYCEYDVYEIEEHVFESKENGDLLFGHMSCLEGAYQKEKE